MAGVQVAGLNCQCWAMTGQPASQASQSSLMYTQWLEHWQLKPETWVWFPVTPSLNTLSNILFINQVPGTKQSLQLSQLNPLYIALLRRERCFQLTPIRGSDGTCISGLPYRYKTVCRHLQACKAWPSWSGQWSKVAKWKAAILPLHKSHNYLLSSACKCKITRLD